MLAEILGPDMLVIFAIVALLFGGAKLPKLAHSLGSAKKEFERGVAGEPEGQRPDTPEPVTMTRADLEAMLTAREEAARRDVTGTQPPTT